MTKHLSSSGAYDVKAALCSFNGPPHLHRNASREHPDHHPKVFVDADLTFDEALRRVGQLCRSLDREPTFAELQAVLT